MSSFWGTGMSGLLNPLDEKNIPASLRQRIALAMMMKKSAAPKNIGEGLYSIGDDFANAFAARGLFRDAAATEGVASAAEADILSRAAPPTASPVRRSSYAAEDPADTAEAPAGITPVTAPPVTPPTQFPQSGLSPAAPLPPDEVPGGTGLPGSAPFRMPSAAAVQDGRNALPPLPPGIIPPQSRTVMPPPPPPPQASPVAIQPSPPPPAEAAPASPFGPGGRFDSALPGRQSAMQPPPGTPVMAGGEPDITEMGPQDVANPAQINAGRNALASALMARQQQAALPPQPATPPAAAPPAPPPPVIAQAPPQQTIRPAPRPQQPDTDPGYVPAFRPERPPAPTTTPLLQDIASRIRATAPRDREAVQARLAPLIAQEQKKVEALHEADKLARQHDLAVNLEREKALQTSAQRRQTHTKGAQELVPDDGNATANADPRLLGTPQSPQRTGVPNVPQRPAGVPVKEWAEKHVPELIKQSAVVDKLTPQVHSMVDIIKQAREHPGKELSLGATGHAYRHTPTGAGFTALNEQLKGQTFLAAYEQLRGAGNIGEKEGAAATSAQARLATAQNKEDYDKALDDLEKVVRGGLEQAQRKMNMPVTAWQRSHDDPVAPDRGQLSPGGEFEYVSGNPNDRSSWRRRR